MSSEIGNYFILVTASFGISNEHTFLFVSFKPSRHMLEGISAEHVIFGQKSSFKASVLPAPILSNSLLSS